MRDVEAEGFQKRVVGGAIFALLIYGCRVISNLGLSR